MEIRVERKYRTDRTTISTLSIGFAFLCYILEDKDRGLSQHMDAEQIKRIKVWGQTAIPAGKYEVKKVFWARHNRHFMQLQNVPGYSGIFIHAGNKAEDTEGCLLPGKTKGPDFVGNSKKALAELEEKVMPVLDAGEHVWIIIE